MPLEYRYHITAWGNNRQRIFLALRLRSFQAAHWGELVDRGSGFAQGADEFLEFAEAFFVAGSYDLPEDLR
jgi:hypothetical protein